MANNNQMESQFILIHVQVHFSNNHHLLRIFEEVL